MLYYIYLYRKHSHRFVTLAPSYVLHAAFMSYKEAGEVVY